MSTVRREFSRVMIFIGVSWLSPFFTAGLALAVLVFVFDVSAHRARPWVIAGAIFAVDAAATAYTSRKLDQGAWEFSGSLSRRIEERRR